MLTLKMYLSKLHPDLGKEKNSETLRRHKEVYGFLSTGFISNDVLSEWPEDPALSLSRTLIISQAFRSFNYQIVQKRIRKLC